MLIILDHHKGRTLRITTPVSWTSRRQYTTPRRSWSWGRQRQYWLDSKPLFRSLLVSAIPLVSLSIPCLANEWSPGNLPLANCIFFSTPRRILKDYCVGTPGPQWKRGSFVSSNKWPVLPLVPEELLFPYIKKDN